MRKGYFIAVTLLLIAFSAQSQVKWMSFSEAVEAQKKNKKPIFMDIYTVWCGPCKILEKNTFNDAEISKVINEKYNPVKFNGEGNEAIDFYGKKFSNPNYSEAKKNTRNAAHEFTSFLNLRGYPTMYIIDATGKVSKSIVGYRTPEQLKPEI